MQVFVEQGWPAISYAVFVDEGRYYRHRLPHPCTAWRDWAPTRPGGHEVSVLWARSPPNWPGGRRAAPCASGPPHESPVTSLWPGVARAWHAVPVAIREPHPGRTGSGGRQSHSGVMSGPATRR
jgi:hypothetical protein